MWGKQHAQVLQLCDHHNRPAAMPPARKPFASPTLPCRGAFFGFQRGARKPDPDEDLFVEIASWSVVYWVDSLPPIPQLPLSILRPFCRQRAQKYAALESSSCTVE